MATVTVVTAERTLEIEANSVTGGHIDGSGHLILTTFDATEIDCGSVVGSIADASDTVKGIIEIATDAETITGTDANRAVTPFALSAKVASDTAKGIVELATSAETITGTDTTRAVTPAGMAAVVASATAKGLVELATDAELATGTDTTRAVTPANVASLVASATAKGIVELATDAEATTGTDTTRAITAANLAAVKAAQLQPLDSDLTAIAAISPANDDVVQRKSGAWTNRTMTQLATDLQATGEFPNTMLYVTSAYVDTESTNFYIGSVDPGSVSNGSVWFDTTP